MNISADTSDFDKFSADLSNAKAEAFPNIYAAVEVTSRNIKDTWNKHLTEDANSRMPNVGRSVDYDIGVSLSGAGIGGYGVSIESEIGPKLGGAGSFAGWFEDGKAVVGIPQTSPGSRAAKANEGDFIEGLSKAVSDPLR